MKKIFTLVITFISTISLAQSFSAYKMNNSQSATLAVLTNGFIQPETTSITTNTNSPTVHVSKIKIINDAATTVTLGLQRYVLFNTPTLKLDGGTGFPDTYFCFGYTCFGSNVNTAPSSDYTILGPSGTTLTPADNSIDAGQPFLIDLAETTYQGVYFVRYKLYNVNNPNDTLSFTIKYNEAMLGVNESKNVIESASDIFPNPSSSNASVSLNLKSETSVKIQIFNSLGSLVSQVAEQKYSQGKNKISFDCSQFNSGIYLVSITAGESKITKRMVINK